MMGYEPMEPELNWADQRKYVNSIIEENREALTWNMADLDSLSSNLSKGKKKE